MGTMAVGAALLFIVALVVYSMAKDRRNGRSLQCGCDCKHCSGHCGKG